MYTNDREEVLYSIKNIGVIAIIRTGTPQKALKIAKAIIDGGLKAIEFSYTMPFANDLVCKLSEKYKNSDILIGAGTVLDPETARIAIMSGANYIISPYLNIDTVQLCNRYRIAYIPGAMTVKEVADCMDAGAGIIKVFPSELFGPAIIKAIKGPLPQAPLMPTGGVNLDNLSQWFEAGVDAVGIGSNLSKGAENENYTGITELSERYVEKIKSIKFLLKK